MARPSQYSRGRRLVMQLTLLVALLCTLGLATLVARSRERAMAVELTAKPHLTPQLAMRLPKGWPVEQNGDELPITVIAREPANPPSLKSRRIVVYQTLAPTGGAEQLLRRYLNKRGGESGSFQSFEILGQPGVLARFEMRVPEPNDPYERQRLVPTWYAAAGLRGAGPKGADLGVVIGVEGYTTAGPAGSQLIRQIADALSVRKR
jgi:hypothetical protein